MAVVNGPIRHEIGMNCGIGAMGPYNHANATIGRAWGLLSQNLQGGSDAGPDLHGLAGQQLRLHQHHASPRTRSAAPGSRSTSSTASGRPTAPSASSAAAAHTAFTLGLREKHWREHVRNMLRGMDPHEPPLFVLDPITARQFIDRGGFDTKEKLIDWAYENAHDARPASTGTTS